MSSMNVKVEGFDELIAKLKEIGDDKSKRRETLIILRQIAKPTIQAAKNEVPVSKKPHRMRGEIIQPGNLKKSIGTITGKNREVPTILVGPRVKGNNKGWYGHFVHDGVNIYRKGFKRKRAGGVYLERSRRINSANALRRTKANPFLRRAIERTNGQVTADAEKRFSKFIQRRIKKLST